MSIPPEFSAKKANIGQETSIFTALQGMGVIEEYHQRGLESS
jgi:hypothetical protein